MANITYHSLLRRLKLESSEENTQLWTKLKSFPLGGIKDPIAINHNEFVVAPNKSPKFNINALYKFTGSDINKWNEYIKYPDNIALTSDHNLAFDEEKQILYIHNRQAHILIFNIPKKECIAKKINFRYDVRNSYVNATGIIINNKFNIIGGMRNTLHIEYNEKLSIFSSGKYMFNDFQTGFYGQSAIRIKKGKNTDFILLFGGTDAYKSQSINTIYKYDILNKKWIKLNDISLPNRVSFVSSVLTQNKKYVILFGGIYDEYDYTDLIYIYDIDKNKIFESRIKCPNKQHRYGAVILSDLSIKQAQLLICGYLKINFKIINFPIDIVSVIKLLYNKEYVHLIQNNKGSHWKILVSDLVSNCKPIST